MADTRLPGDAPDSDLEWHAWPPPPPRGGQHVGRYGHGVLVIHRPTGLAAISTEERSQLRNRETAWERLRRVLVQAGHIKRPKPDPATCHHLHVGLDRAFCFDCGATLEPET